MQPTRICVARHGETDWNAVQTLQGWIDVALNDKGLRQANELAEHLAGAHLSCVYTSPLQRAARTADIVSARLRLGHPVHHPGLKERNFGIFQGRPKSELAVTHPKVLRDIVSRNPATHFDEGESMDAFADRVLDSLRDIARHNPGRRVLVITHGWVMDVITRQSRHLPRSAILNLKRKNIECHWIKVLGGSSIVATESD
jgi:probable phosphoglycerate mutase